MLLTSSIGTLRTAPDLEPRVSGKHGGEQNGRRRELSIIESPQLGNEGGETAYMVSYESQITDSEAYLWQRTRSETDK